MLFKITHLVGPRETDDLERDADDRGICETVRDAVRDILENARDRAHTCDEVKNHTREPITVCVQDKEKSRNDGRWRGGTREVQPGETIKVDRNKEDIEGIVHRDGSVTKLKGALCDGWTDEHDAAWLRNNWADCAPARGGSVSPRNFFGGLAESSVYTFARVDAAGPNWQDGRPLAANHSYRVIPRSSDRWTYDRGRTFVDFHGSRARMNGAEIGIPKDNLPIGGVVCLVWHHQADGSAWPQIIDFPAGAHAAEFAIGAHGGSIHFVIADRVNTYADNFGDCLIALSAL